MWVLLRLMWVGLFAMGEVNWPQTAQKPHYVGSESCKKCHEAAYAGWKQTRMADVVRDPKEHPEVVLG